MGWRRDQRKKRKGKKSRKTDFEIYKEIRKQAAPPSQYHEDESKYSRKRKDWDDEGY